MKLKLILSFILISGLPLFSQQKVNVALEKQEEMIRQLQVENQNLEKELDNLDKEIDVYREDVRSTASNLHDDMSHWLVILSIIMTLIGGIVGVLFPVLINARHDKLAAKKYDETLKALQEQLDAASHQANVAVEQAQKSDDALKETQDLKEQISQIKTEVDANVSKAEQAAKDALVSQWVTEAGAEEQENPETAIKLYSRIINMSPNSSVALAYNNRGIIKAKKKDYEGAVQDFTNSIEIDPDSAKAYFNRGSALFFKGDWDAAQLDADRAISIDPKSFCYALRGRIRLKNNNEKGALEDYNEAIALDPQNAEYYYRRSEVRLKTDDQLGAMEDLNRSIILDAHKPNVYYTRGRLKESYSLDDAIDDYDRAISLNSHEPDYYKRRSLCLTKLAKKEPNTEKRKALYAKAELDDKMVESLSQS